MISNFDLESRIYKYFDNVFLSDKVSFNFPTASSASFIVDRQTDAPRPAVSTVLYYRIEENTPYGNMVAVDTPRIDRSTGIEYIDTFRVIHVVVNVLSKKKGDAKTAMNWLLGVNQSTRGYNASYGVTGTFDLPIHHIDHNLRDLTTIEKENRAWTERIEADFYFNYKDTIQLGEIQPFIVAPSAWYETNTKIDYEIDFIGGN